jgi:trk system potassium uptake protein TrkH
MITGVSLCISASTSLEEMDRRHAFLMTATVWLTAAAAGALPLYMWSLPLTDAFFESMSGITTTGSTVMTGLDTTPRGILLWRAMLQWLGGVGFIVTGIALLPLMKVGGMQLFRTESSDKGDKELRSAAVFAAATLWIYVSLSAACATVYVIGGMGAFDAITHAMTTLSTGGYSNYDSSFGHFDSSFLQWSGTLFMMFGALPFAWYIRAVNRRVLHSEQVVAFLSMLGIVISILTIWRVATSSAAPLDALRLVAFNVVSVVTTTGYATTDYTVWGPFAAVAFFCLTAVGGCTGSTAGGAKLMRWIVLVRSIGAQIRLIHNPHRVYLPKYEGHPIDPDVLSGVIGFFTFYFLSAVLLTVALDLAGLDFSTSVTGALTALANVGPGVGQIIGPSGNFASLEDLPKWIIAFGMYIGRLEMLTVVVVLTPAFWRSIR